MILGAEARDVIHASLGHTFQLRSTSDLDIGVAMSDWGAYDHAVNTYALIGDSGIRRNVEGIAVDFVPFGDLEHPSGVVTPQPRNEPLIVFGFKEVFTRSDSILLPSGAEVRIPTPAGYALLKMRAWLDRMSYADKDAGDLAVAAYWYMNDLSLSDRTYDPSREEKLSAVDWDGGLAAAELLGEDIAAHLEDADRSDLLSRWQQFDPDRTFVTNRFTFGADDPLYRNLPRRKAVVDCIIRGASNFS